MSRSAMRKAMGRRRAVPLALALLPVLLVAAPGAAAETVIIVGSADDTEAGSYQRCAKGGECSLREALERVAEGEGAGVSGPVTVALEVEGEIGVGAEGELTVSPGAGVDSIAIEGPGSSRLSVDAEGESRVFKLEGGEVRISGLTIEGGSVTGEAIDGEGGAGIYSEAARIILEAVRVTDNQVASYRDGGGIGIEEGALLRLVDSRVDGNRAERYGGGIFIDNFGGALIEGSEIDHNRAESGGGLEARASSGSEASLSVSGSSIVANEASEGGGLYLEVPGKLVGSTVSENIAALGEGGGGLTVETDGMFSILASTIAVNHGGGIHGRDGEVRVEGSTIAANSVSTGPGAGIDGGGFRLKSTALAGNVSGDEELDCSAEVTSEGGNILGTSAEAGGCEWEGPGGDAFETDPGLEPPAQNGGPTLTMAPSSRESPVINRGAENGEGTDQRGFTRPVPPGDYDVGAVEVQAPVNEEPPTIEAPSEPRAGDTITCAAGTWNTDGISDPVVEVGWHMEGEAIGSQETLELKDAYAGKPIECGFAYDNGVTATAASSQTFELPPASIQVSASELDLGARRVGSGPGNGVTLSIANDGGASLEVDAATSSDPGQFPVEATDCLTDPVPPGSSCEVLVEFAPAATGLQSAELKIESNAGEVGVELSGSGTEALFEVSPTEGDFGERPIGSGPSDAQSFTVTNAGTASMTIGSVALSGSDASQFQLSEDGCGETTLEPGGECELAAVFVPTRTGPQSAAIDVPGEAPGSIPIGGTGTEPQASVAPGEGNFGSQTVDSPPGAPQVFSVTSTGTAPLEIGEASITGAGAASFAIAAGSDTCSRATLAPGGVCTLAVSFSPRVAGAAVATLELPGNAPASISLTGSGIESPPLPPPLSPPPLAVEAAPRALLLARRGAYVVRGRKRIAVRLRCASDGPACRMSLKLTRGGRLVGRWRGGLGPGESRKARLLLTRRGRRELTLRRQLRAALRIATAGGRTTVARIAYRLP